MLVSHRGSSRWSSCCLVIFVGGDNPAVVIGGECVVPLSLLVLLDGGRVGAVLDVDGGTGCSSVWQIWFSIVMMSEFCSFRVLSSFSCWASVGNACAGRASSRIKPSNPSRRVRGKVAAVAGSEQGSLLLWNNLLERHLTPEGVP